MEVKDQFGELWEELTEKGCLKLGEVQTWQNVGTSLSAVETS